MEELKSYRDELEFVANSDDSLYPDFLFSPIFNSFGDNYYEKSFVDSGLKREAQSIKRRYTSYFEWVNAMDVYNEYMDMLAERYGSRKTIKNTVKLGLMDEFVPPKPKLKSTKANRLYEKTGIVPAEKADIPPMTPEEIVELTRKMWPDKTGEDIPDDGVYIPKTKKEKKALKKASRKVEGAIRQKNMYVGSNTLDNIGSYADFLVTMLNARKCSGYSSRGEWREDQDEMQLQEIVEAMEEYERTPEALRDDILGDQSVISGGRLIKKSEADKAEILMDLIENGVNINKNEYRSNKKVAMMLKQKLGKDMFMSKKELKKWKKKQKKKRKELDAKVRNNEAFRSLLGNNKFADGGTIDFTFDSVFGE